MEGRVVLSWIGQMYLQVIMTEAEPPTSLVYTRVYRHARWRQVRRWGQVRTTPHKGGNTIELPPWKKGWHRPMAPQYARPHFMRCRSPLT